MRQMWIRLLLQDLPEKERPQALQISTQRVCRRLPQSCHYAAPRSTGRTGQAPALYPAAIPEKEWDKLAQEATDKWLAETGQTRRQITDIDTTLARLDRQLTTIRQQVTDGIFNAQDYAAERDRLQGDMAVLEKERGTLTSPTPKSWDIQDFRRDVLEALYYQSDSMETWTDQQWYESVDRNDVRIEVLEPNGGELGAKLRLRSVLKDLDLTNGVKVELPDKVVLTHRNPPSFGSAA